MSKIPVLIDGDPGHDDVMAIVMALNLPEIDVLGITVVGGNSTLENTATNALRTLEWLSVEGVSVVKGRAKPMIRTLETAASVHGEGGLDGPDFPPLKTKVLDENFATFMAKKIEEQTEKVVLVAMGPLTNTAVFLASYPHLKEKIAKIVIMGGAAVGGNWTSTAEFNIWVDPESAYVVFESGIPVVMCGLDATNKARLTKNEIKKFLALGTPAGDLIGQLSQHFADMHPEKGDDEIIEVPMHDAVTIATLVSDDIVKLIPARVAIDITGDHNRGCTTVQYYSWAEPDMKKNAFVSVDLDREKFVDLLMSCCK